METPFLFFTWKVHKGQKLPSGLCRSDMSFQYLKSSAMSPKLFWFNILPICFNTWPLSCTPRAYTFPVFSTLNYFFRILSVIRSKTFILAISKVRSSCSNLFGCNYYQRNETLSFLMNTSSFIGWVIDQAPKISAALQGKFCCCFIETVLLFSALKNSRLYAFRRQSQYEKQAENLVG